MASTPGSSPGSAPMPATSALEQGAERYARSFIKRSRTVPDHINYDWVPFFTALSLLKANLVGLNDINVDLQGNKAPSQDRFRQVFDPKRTPTKDPNSGSWNYVWYIPEWGYPGFDPTVLKTYQGKTVSVNPSEALFGLRPALRIEDAIKRPTEYALRFGIHPDELSGRSRTSPSLSVTRDPFDDLVNQINLLDDTDKQHAVDASKSLWQSTSANQGDSQLIHPNVIENILEKKGVLSNKQLIDSLREALNEKNMNLEQFIAQVNMAGPLVWQSHSNFLTKATEDQDWQRVLFLDLTTDELIKENIHTMSNEFYCDLKGPLHFILRRDHWEVSDWKGAYPHEPRYLYNLNGKREEWDATTNDTVWEALQPALQLVTRLLYNRHPHFEALINMETRQMIENWRDPRDDPPTPNLAKYVLEKDIDFQATFPEIIQLNELGYDWKYHTWRVLARCLRFDIGTCYVVPGYHDEYPNTHGVKHQDSMAYGVTTRNSAGPDSNITITISAELIWPLLMSEYSQSEKMSASFVLASTIIHEIAHATQYAHSFLMEDNWIQPDDQSDETTEQLMRLGSRIVDYDFCLGEHCFQESGFAEVGFELEKALWGFTVSTLMEGVAAWSGARYIETLPLIAMGRQFPFSPRWNSEPECLHGTILPVEDYLIPLPLDYIGRFFTQHFWDTEFQVYGFQALKQLPPDSEDRVMKRVMRDDYIDYDRAKKKFGERDWSFLDCVAYSLKSNRYTVLGSYLESQLMDVLRRVSFQKKWTEQIELWTNDVINPLDQESKALRLMLQESQVTNAKVNAPESARQNYYFKYLGSNQHPSVPMTFPEWKDNIEKIWYEDFRDGGRLMTQFAEVHRFMRDDLSFLQRMIFDYFNTELTKRGPLYGGNGSADNTPIGAAYKRIISFRSTAQTFHLSAGAIARIPELVDIWKQWGHWRARFENNFTMYENMLKLLERDPTTIGPEDDWWKVQFGTMPTAYWKNRAERLRVVAFRDYMKLEPRIRQTVDDFALVMTSVNAAAALPDPADVNTINDKLKYIAKNWNDATKKVIDDKPTIFDFTVPQSVPLSPGIPGGGSSGGTALNPTPPAPSTPPQPGASTGGNTIQTPGPSVTSLGGTTSRRTARRTPVPESTPAAATQQPGIFAQYGSSANPMQVSVAPDAAPMYPRPWGPGYGGSSFGPGAPFLAQSQPQPLGPGTIRNPFPNPYSTAATTTLDIVRDQQRQKLYGLQNMANIMDNGPEHYTTKDQWRERGSPGSSSGGSPPGG
ncbi:hypothetical protein F5X99DRAFT_430838 [Biscogniauxia marginata]|nr:hypothetical protein F5X99DRAFT_430838 [Biscogniauxia marginata]